jgi:hypothetical protein
VVGVSPRLVLRDTRGWGEYRLETLGFIPFDTLVPGWLLGIRVAGASPWLAVRDSLGWGESQLGDIRFYTFRFKTSI